MVSSKYVALAIAIGSAVEIALVLLGVVIPTLPPQVLATALVYTVAVALPVTDFSQGRGIQSDWSCIALRTT